MSGWTDLGIDLPYGATGRIRVTCPKCSHTRKPAHQRERCLSVHVEEGVFKCHNCGWIGGLPGAGIWQESLPSPTYTKPEPPPERRLTKPAQDFLTARGINLAVALDAGLYTDGEWLAIPYHRDGEIVHVKYRHLTEKRFRADKGTEHVAYGLDWCRDADAIVVCEGELDALALLTAGIDAVLSVPDGVNSATGGAFLASVQPLFAEASRIILAVDGDEAGQTLAATLLPVTGPEKTATVAWPAGTKDANDVLLRDGPDKLRALIDRAAWTPVPGIIGAGELTDAFLRFYRGETDPSFDAGLPMFDQHYRVGLGQLTVVTGISFHGKTTFLDFLLLQYMKRHDWHIIIFSPEQYPPTRHAAVLAAQLVGKPMPSQWRDVQGVMSEREAVEAIGWVSRHVTFLDPEGATVDELLRLAGIVAARTGAKGLVLDPWNEIAHDRSFMSETLYTGDVLRRFKTFARQHGLHVWLVAHPTKLPRQSPDDPEIVPGLEHISGSNNFRNKADMGLTVWRDIYDMDHRDRVLVRVTKAKHRDFGLIGDVSFHYEAQSHRFLELAQPITKQKGFSS